MHLTLDWQIKILQLEGKQWIIKIKSVICRGVFPVGMPWERYKGTDQDFANSTFGSHLIEVCCLYLRAMSLWVFACLVSGDGQDGSVRKHSSQHSNVWCDPALTHHLQNLFLYLAMNISKYWRVFYIYIIDNLITRYFYWLNCPNTGLQLHTLHGNKIHHYSISNRS